MKSCKGCVYEKDMKESLSGGVLYWAGSSSHPFEKAKGIFNCFECIRYPRQAPEEIDNYQPKELKEEVGQR